jgi:hypothetical protein
MSNQPPQDPQPSDHGHQPQTASEKVQPPWLAGPGHGQIAVRVGRLLVYLNDREALESFTDAWRRAEALADKAFRPLDAASYPHE